MISKLQMDDVASYKNSTSIETDRKVNIIYGLNGSGKSTISNFLYDQDNKDFKSCTVDISDDELVLVYNKRFIRDNFYDADSLKGIFSLSKANKDIEENINSLNKELVKLDSKKQTNENKRLEQDQLINTKRSKAQETVWAIRKNHTGGDRILEYCLEGLKGKKETLFGYLLSIPLPTFKPSKDIAKLKNEVEKIQGDSATTYQTLNPIGEAASEIEKHQIFSEIVIGKTDSLVADLINKLENSDWVSAGLKYINLHAETEGVKCPFCQEQTITKILSNELEEYFDDAYKNSLALILEKQREYEIISSNLLELDQYETSPFAIDRISDLALRHQALRDLYSANKAKITLKHSKPSLAIELQNTSIAREEFNSLLRDINSEIKSHNLKLQNVKEERNKLKEEFWNLMRWEYDQTISAWNNDSKNFDQWKNKAQADSVILNSNISEKQLKVAKLQKSTVNIESAIASINRGLFDLGITEFTLEKHKDILYKIVRTGVKSTEFSSLSEGEKMIISFLYFCELCRGKRTATEINRKKIAIIDDPVSSLSHNYVFNIGQLLKTDFFNSKDFQQVFVLTHSLYFFYELADNNHTRRTETQKLFRLHKNELGSQFIPMKYEEIQNDYHSYWYVVTDPSQPPALIANCMRNIIEYFFNFIRKSDLSNVIQMTEFKENKYQAFCRYINRESHSLGQNIFDYKEFDYDSFREGFRMVFKAVGYEEHYTKMVKSFKSFKS